MAKREKNPNRDKSVERNENGKYGDKEMQKKHTRLCWCCVVHLRANKGR